MLSRHVTPTALSSYGTPMYVKLFGSILDSSIWSTDLATRVVWITMLAMADEFGVVHASVGGLARRAQVPIAECRRALQTLSTPDEDDRSGVRGGQRIEALQGAWQLINYQHYRELRSHKQVVDAARQARHRRRACDVSPNGVTDHDVTVEAEAEAEVEAVTTTTTTKSNTARSRANWVRRLGGIWRKRYQGTPPWGQIGKLLLPVKDEPELDRRFTAYLEATEPQFVNLAKFVASFGSWGNGKKAPQSYSYEPGQSGPNL